MYFTITPFIYSLRDKNLKLLNKLNLSNYINDIIIFLQKNKFDSNNAENIEIIQEQDEIKYLIKKLKIDDNIDFSSSGYAAQLFSIFNIMIIFASRKIK